MLKCQRPSLFTVTAAWRLSSREAESGTTILATILLATVLLSSPARAQDKSRIDPDVVYGHKDGLAMTMDVYHSDDKDNDAAVLFMVSGGWFSPWAPPDRNSPFIAPYLKAGYTVFAVRHGSSPRYTIPEAVADVRRAVRFVRGNADRFGISANRLGVFGMSAGGHLSLMLGTTGDDGDPNARDAIDRASSRVAAVVAFVPPTDLRVAVWDAPESVPAYRAFPGLNLDMEKAKENSPLVHVTKDDAPSLVIMGGKDELVPAKHGEWIDTAFEKERVTRKLIIFPEADHGLSGKNNRETAFREAVLWFDKHLREPEQRE